MMGAALRSVAVGAVLLLSQSVQAEDDAHDKLVYSRYAKQLQPSGVKVLIRDHSKVVYSTELDRPATKMDVEAGRAIFTFEGLGESSRRFLISVRSSTRRPLRACSSVSTWTSRK
jgi:hypothetical protein